MPKLEEWPAARSLRKAPQQWTRPHDQYEQRFASSKGLVIDGRLLLEERLGEGSMGEVWRAKHLERQSHVAVKLLAPSLLGSPAGEKHVASFVREASSPGASTACTPCA